MPDAPIAPAGHSRFGFSAAERWLACPASVTAQAGLPERPSSYAQRGTRLHEAAAVALLRQEDAATVLPHDEEGQDIVQPYLDTVRNARARLDGPGTVLLVERQFRLDLLHAELWGTSDAVIVSPAYRTVWCADLKTGAGHPVRPRRADGSINVQIGGYALGALLAVPAGTIIDTVEATVVQPLNGGVMTAVVGLAEMADLAADLLDGVERALKPNPVFLAGDHCRWCLAAPTCAAFRETAFASAQLDFAAPDMAATLTDPATLAPPDIARALTAASLLDDWITTIRETALGMLQRGEAVPGWKLVQKRGRRRWRDEEQAAAALIAAGLPKHDLYEMALLSPAQVERVAKRRKLDVPLGALVESISSGATMAPEDDPRAAVQAGAALGFTPQPDT